MEKTKEYSLIIALLIVCLLVLGHILASTTLVFLSISAYLALLLLSKEEYIFPLILFFLPWSTMLKFSPSSISFASIATILLFFSLLLKKTQLSVSVLISSLLLFLITIVSKTLQNYSISSSYIMNIMMIVAFPMLLFWCKDKVKFKQCILYFAAGIISGSVISFIVIGNYNIAKFVGRFSELEAERYCGFYSDPNYFSAHVLTAVGGLLLLEEDEQKEWLMKVFLTVCLVVLGLTSVSKSFLISLLLLFSIWVVNLLYEKPSTTMLSLFVGFIVFLGMAYSGIFSGIINNYRIRFELAEDISGLTTGRSDIWELYIDFLLHNPVKLLIGQGYTDDSYSALGIASHNIFIQLIYQLGVVGLIFFIMWLRSAMPWKKIGKLSFLHVLIWALACFNMWMGLDMMFLDDMFLMIVLFYIGVYYIATHKKKKSKLSCL